MIVVVGEFYLPLDRRIEALAAMQRVVTASRAEAGCLAYAYAEDVIEKGLFRVNETWESRAHLSAHFAMPHMDKWKRERAELGMSRRTVIAYAVSSEEVL